MSGGVLQINGWDFGVQAVESNGQALGSAERAIDLSPLLSSRRPVQQYTFTSSDLSAADAAALRTLLSPGDADLWPLNASTVWSGLSKAGEAGAVTTLEPVLGKFGAGALEVSDAITNDMTAQQQAFASAGGWGGVSGASATITSGAAVAGYTASGGYRIQITGGSSTLKYRLQKVAATAGAFTAVSVVVANTGPASLVVRQQGIVASYGTSPLTVPAGTVARFAVAGTASGGTRELRFETLSAGDSLDFVAFQPQLLTDVGGAYAFTASSRSAGALPLASLTSGQAGTEAWWWTPRMLSAAITAQASSPAIATLGDYFGAESWRLWAWSNAGAEPSLAIYIRGPTSSGWTTSTVVRASGSGWYTPNTPIHMAVTWSGGTYYVYVAGAQYGPYALSDQMTFARGARRLNLGTAGGSCAGNGLYNGRVTAAYALSASAIAALANRTTAIPAFPALECTGSAFDGRTVYCKPVGLPKVRTMAGDGTWRTVDFTLEEIE